MSTSPKGSGWRRAQDALAVETGSLADVDGVGVLKRLAQQDAAALVDLHQTLGAPMFSVALRMLDDRGDAEEALQDAYVRIWKRAGEFDPQRGRPFTWCCLMLRTCCLDRVRRNTALKRGGGKIVRMDPKMLEETAGAGSSDVHELAVWNERVLRVRSALANLKPTERRYIEDAVFEGKTHHEISDERGEPLGTVKSCIRRGLIKLRKSLKTDPNTDT